MRSSRPSHRHGGRARCWFAQAQERAAGRLLEDSPGRHRPLADHADAACADGRVWAAADRVAQPEGAPANGPSSRWSTWGLKNGHLEPWDFGHPGWLNERLSAHIVSPVKDALVVEALAWTPGTNGPVRAAAVQVTLPQRPTQDELTAYLEKIKDAVKGKMVLVGPPQRCW